jgi:hypothetical protein
MTKFHNGFIEGGTAREKLKHLNKWINRLKETRYTPHPFEIIGANANESTLSSLSKTTSQSTHSPD